MRAGTFGVARHKCGGNARAHAREQRATTASDVDRSGILGLSGDQWATLLNFLNAQKT